MVKFRYILVNVMSFFLNIYYMLNTKKLYLGWKSRIVKGSQLYGYNKIERFSVFSGELGYASYIGANSLIIGKIGKFCSIGGNVTFLTATHPVNKFVSTHPAFYSLKKQSGFTFVKHQKFEEYPKYDNSKFSINIGNDVYIGYGVTIIGPVCVGDGAVIAANSVVIMDVEPYTIVGGNPAKEIKKRFSQEEIEFLKKLKWWDKDIEWLENKSYLFDDIEKMTNIDCIK